MSPELALDILTQATANMSGTRDQHDQIIKALSVMRTMIHRSSVLSEQLAEVKDNEPKSIA